VFSLACMRAYLSVHASTKAQTSLDACKHATGHIVRPDRRVKHEYDA
jgi:hypothetical protein